MSNESPGVTARAADQVKADAKNIVSSAAVGAAQGAVVGGGLPGAAVGAAKGALVGVVRSKTGMVIAIALVLAMVIGAVAVAAQLTSAVTLIAQSLSASDSETSVRSATSSGSDDEAIAEARDLVAYSGVPWEIAASTKLETGEQLDIDATLAALEVHDRGSRYRALGAGATYNSDQSARTVTDQEAAARVEQVWIAVLNDVVEGDEQISTAIYRQALAWHLGQTFGICSSELGNGGDGTEQELDSEQLGYAGTILGVAKGAFEGANTQRQAAIIAVTTALQESSLRNLDSGDRDSVGLFQQRPSAGWGTVEQIMNPVYATSKFYEALSAVAGWQSLPVGEAAQAVQVSAYPDEYAKWENTARVTVAQLFAATAPIEPTAGPITAPSEDSVRGSLLCIGGNLIVNGDTVTPVVNYELTSRFGPRVSPVAGASTNHKGLDMARDGCQLNPPVLEPIYAIQDGTVTRSQVWGTYGTMIEIDHGADFVTRYAHLLAGSSMVTVGQPVSVGQPIGIMGSTGASTGCHLHFETFVNGKAENPEVVMLRLGVLL